MTKNSNRMISDFSSKPRTRSFFADIDAYVTRLGPVEKTLKAQVSYSLKRKFLWLWAYEKTSDGTLYLTVMLDEEVHDPRFHYVTQVSSNRWNHHVEVKSEEIANSEWLHALIRKGYAFAQR